MMFHDVMMTNSFTWYSASNANNTVILRLLVVKNCAELVLLFSSLKLPGRNCQYGLIFTFGTDFYLLVYGHKGFPKSGLKQLGYRELCCCAECYQLSI